MTRGLVRTAARTAALVIVLRALELPGAEPADQPPPETRKLLDVGAGPLSPYAFPDLSPPGAVPGIALLRALAITLEANPQTLLEETNVEQLAGQAQRAAGEFDTTAVVGGRGEIRRRDTETNVRPTPTPRPAPGTSARVPRNETIRTSQSDALAQWEAGLRRKFRNGIQVEPKVVFESKRQKAAGGFTNDTSTRLVFDVVIPLGRGAGFAAQAPELAAKFDLVASIFSLRNVTARNIADAVQAYWQLRAAEERLRLYREAEIEAGRILSISDALAQADELPRSQLAQGEADKEASTAQRVRAEQDLILARLRLATLMGLSPESMPRAPVAADAFPRPSEAGRELAVSVQELWVMALELRDDLRAARELEKSRKVLVDAAWINLRPAIDLQLNGSYLPEQATSTQARYDHAGELAGFVGLSVEWPFANDAARGRYVEDSALYLRSQLQTYDLERDIVAGVVRAASGFRAAAEEVRHLQRAAELYGRALSAQQELYLLGEGSLTDTITARQRAITARIESVNAQERFASAIIELRYQTGTLLPADAARVWITPELWSRPPFAVPTATSP